METSGVTSRVAVDAGDLTDVVLAPGPFATVYLTTDAEVENASQRSELRWRNLRGDLAQAGATDDVLDSIDPLVPDAHLRGQTLAVIANTAGVLHVSHWPELPKRDFGRWSSLPSLGPVLEWRQSSPPHVVVLTDRRGADLVAVGPEGGQVRREAGGGADPLAKSQPGGWSQKRYQQRAENTWEHNAKDVAEQLVELVDRVGARLVVVAGDVRAVQMLQEALPAPVAGIVEVVEGTRSAGGSPDEVATDLTRLVATVAARDTVAVLQKFREERGQGDRAVDGPEKTIEALAMAQVDVVLVHDDPDDPRTAWFGPDGTHVAADSGTLAAMGVERPMEGRLPDVLMRAALGTGAGVRIVPSGSVPTGGAGAILRWTS